MRSSFFYAILSCSRAICACADLSFSSWNGAFWDLASLRVCWDPSIYFVLKFLRALWAVLTGEKISCCSAAILVEAAVKLLAVSASWSTSLRRGAAVTSSECFLVEKAPATPSGAFYTGENVVCECCRVLPPAVWKPSFYALACLCLYLRPLNSFSVSLRVWWRTSSLTTTFKSSYIFYFKSRMRFVFTHMSWVSLRASLNRRFSFTRTG